MVTDEEKWAELSEQHQGHDYLLECVGQHPQKPDNKLCKMLFPKSKGVKLTDYELGEETPFSSDFYGQKIIKLLQEEESLTGSEVSQLGRRLSHVLLGLAAGHFQIPDAAYQLSEYGGGSGESLGKQKKAVEADVAIAEKQVKDSQLKAKTAGLALKKAEQSVTVAEVKYQKLLKDTSSLSTADLARTKQQMEAEIATEKNNLAAQQKKFAKAKKSVLKAQNNISAYAKVNNRWVKYPHARFIDAKAHVLQPALRLVDIAHPGQIQQVEMLASDYFNGNFPEGFLPLDPTARKRAAEKLVLELNQTIRAHSKRVKNVKFHNGSTGKLALEDLLHLNKRLKHLTSQIDSAGKMSELNSLTRIHAYLIKVEGNDLRAEAEVNATKGNVKGKLTAVDNVAAELLNDQALLKNLDSKQKQLQKWVDLKIPETITPQGLKKGLGGLLGVIAVFELMNFTQAASQYKLGWNRTLVDIVGATTDLAAILLTVFTDCFYCDA